MHLCNAGTCSSCPLHDPLARLTSEADPKKLLRSLPKIFQDYFFRIFPVILRSVIEHLGEHFLEFRGQDS